MSLTAAIIDALLVTGVTRDQLAAAVKADIADREAIEESRLEAKRAGNRERKQRERAKSRPSRNVTPVTRDPAPNERDNLTPTREIPTKPNGLEPVTKKHRIPVGWEPMPFKPGSMAALTIIRWEPGRLERELAKFRDHHTAVGTKHEVWQSAWSKWVNQSDDFQRGRNGPNQQPGIGKSAAAFANLNVSDERPF